MVKTARIIRPETDGVIATHPGKKKGLLALLATMQRLGADDAMPEIEDFPPEPVVVGSTEKKLRPRQCGSAPS
jgi:antitoxin VapB